MFLACAVRFVSAVRVIGGRGRGGGLPGTVSGKVSFCMVCIAFNALRALYHLKQDKDILARTRMS